MNYGVQIEEKQNEKQKILNEMNIKKELFLEELIAFTPKWFENETLTSIKAHPDEVIKLGEEKARELKSKIKELQDRSAELVNQYISKEDLWWHTNEDEETYYATHYKLMENHDEEIRIMFGELGNILIEYGIETAKSEYEKVYTNRWCYKGYSHDTEIRYRYNIDFSDKLYEISDEYKNLIRKSQEINKQIESLKTNQQKENIAEWWTSL
ncbi:hypothetical protein [Bacillus mycoides]|uniref:hypothetical protein n=1 Tax=Bacillus mycoides TaxID=1405 RepID=UPI002E23DC1E|nr:hypothetical protein [Bacillus mycoides]